MKLIAKPPHGTRLDITTVVAAPGETKVCANCGDTIHAVPRSWSAAELIDVITIDERGWCAMCLWDEDFPYGSSGRGGGSSTDREDHNA